MFRRQLPLVRDFGVGLGDMNTASSHGTGVLRGVSARLVSGNEAVKSQ
jgi:hypothetical protein